MNPHMGELDMADGLILVGVVMLAAVLFCAWELYTRKRS